MDILAHFNLHPIQVASLKRFNEVLKKILFMNPSGLKAGTPAKIKLAVT